MNEHISTDRLYSILKDLKTRSGIWNSILVTEDGLVIASDDLKQIAGNLETLNYYENIGAITAGALSMAEQAIQLIDQHKELQQQIIHAGTSSHIGSPDSFSIVLTLMQTNIILLVIYPSVLNLGMILYEIEKTKEHINEYMREGDFLLHEESVT